MSIDPAAPPIVPTDVLELLEEASRRYALTTDESDLVTCYSTLSNSFLWAAEIAWWNAHPQPPSEPLTERTQRRPALREELRWSVFHRDGLACVECGATSRLTVDHVIPVVRGGTNDPENLRTLCRSCNSRKGAR